MDTLGTLSKTELEQYLMELSSSDLLEVSEEYLETFPGVSQASINRYLEIADSTDTGYPKALLLTSKLLLNISASSLSLKTTTGLESSQEKITELSNDLYGIKYLGLLPEHKSQTSIDLYNTMWSMIYTLQLSVIDINKLPLYNNEFLPIQIDTYEVQEKPLKVYNSSMIESWWSTEEVDIRSYVYIALLINDFRSTLEKSVTVDLVSIVLNFGISNELGLKLAQAGIQFTIEPLDNCYEVKVFGHFSKVLDAAEKVLEYLYNSSPTLDAIEYATEALKSQYHSLSLDPSSQSRQLRLTFLQHNQYLLSQKLEYLQNMSPLELNLSHVKLLIYACGNIPRAKVEGFSEFAEGLLFAAEGKKLKYLSPRTVTLIPEQVPRWVQNCNDENCEESVVEVYLQLGQASLEERVMSSMLEIIISGFIEAHKDSMFSDLAVSSRMTRGVSGILIKSITKDHNPDLVENTLFEYLQNAYQNIPGLFNDKKTELISIKTRDFKSLSEKTNFLWEEILQGNTEFERQSKEISFLQALTLQNFIDWVDHSKFIKKCLVIKIIALKWGLVVDSTSEEFILDMNSFRKKYPCYSWLRIMH
jgi:secreted Zn-dependent insulinase-like peptidase